MLSQPAGARASQLEWQVERSGLGWELLEPRKVFLQRNVMKERMPFIYFSCLIYLSRTSNTKLNKDG